MLIVSLSHFQPDYELNSSASEAIFKDEDFGNYTLSLVRAEPLAPAVIESNSLLVDEADMFETCEVDPSKYSISGGCEPGIALFCRNEFFPALELEGATKAEFADICNCVTFLCSSLPSGERTGKALNQFQKVYYALFTVIAMITLLVYLISVADLAATGDLRNCE